MENHRRHATIYEHLAGEQRTNANVARLAFEHQEHEHRRVQSADAQLQEYQPRRAVGHQTKPFVERVVPPDGFDELSAQLNAAAGPAELIVGMLVEGAQIVDVGQRVQTVAEEEGIAERQHGAGADAERDHEGETGPVAGGGGDVDGQAM